MCTWSVPASWAATSPRGRAEGPSGDPAGPRDEVHPAGAGAGRASCTRRSSNRRKRSSKPARVCAPMWTARAWPIADLVIEAIFENAEAKQELYARIEPQLQDDEILASNTSSIPLDELRRQLSAPQRFLGLHFFNPVAKMPLVEVVRHDQLDAAVERRALAFCKGLGKLPVAVDGTPGFLVNRILMPYLLEAMRLLQRRRAGAGAGSRGEEIRHADGADRTGRHGGPGRVRLGGQGAGAVPGAGIAVRAGRQAGGRQARQEGRRRPLRLAGRQAAKARGGQGLRDAAGSGRAHDPADDQRGGRVPARQAWSTTPTCSMPG